MIRSPNFYNFSVDLFTQKSHWNLTISEWHIEIKSVILVLTMTRKSFPNNIYSWNVYVIKKGKPIFVCKGNQPGHSSESLSKLSSGEAYPISPFIRIKM